MKTLFIENRVNYDGSALKPLYGYVHHHLRGDSIISFIGKCDVTLEHMVDAEDFVISAKIQSDRMLHFIVEVFGQNLMTAVVLQRLLVSMAQNLLQRQYQVILRRDGDDLYLDQDEKSLKLSVSIASVSAVSAMIHLGMNVENKGTPVPTCALSDFKVDAQEFAQQLMKKFSDEFISMREATQKVKPLA